jgi:hypothetical protein
VRALAQRLEQAGETVFCYTNDPQPVLDTLQDFPGLQHLQSGLSGQRVGGCYGIAAC